MRRNTSPEMVSATLEATFARHLTPYFHLASIENLHIYTPLKANEMHHAKMDRDWSLDIFQREMLYGGADISSLISLIESFEDLDSSNRSVEWNIQIKKRAGCDLSQRSKAA